MATNITIKSNVKPNLDRYERSVLVRVKNQVSASALIVETQAKKNAPVKVGRLRASIRQLIKSDQGFRIRVGTNVEYAEKMEFTHPTKSLYLTRAANKERPIFMKKIGKILNKVK